MQIALRCSYGAIGAFRDIAEAPGCAAAVMPDAKGLFPEDHPQYTGIYCRPVRMASAIAVMDQQAPGGPSFDAGKPFTTPFRSTT